MLIRFNTNAPKEIRSFHEIKRIQEKRGESKLKNMKKDKRRVIEGNKRKEKAELQKNGYLGTKAGSRKVKAVLRR